MDGQEVPEANHTAPSCSTISPRDPGHGPPLECAHAVSLRCAQKPRQRTCILNEVIIDPSAWAGWLYAQRFGTCLSRAAISGCSTVSLL